jgi:hypothetical protein
MIGHARTKAARGMGPTIFISAGEASGEHYGALLMQALKRRLSQRGATASFIGMGGERMAAEGLSRVVRSEDMAVMGITEVVRHLPRIYGGFRKLKEAVRSAIAPTWPCSSTSPTFTSSWPGAASARRAGNFFVSPQLMGLEEAPHPTGAASMSTKCW